jgi:hypothetical protein
MQARSTSRHYREKLSGDVQLRDVVVEEVQDEQRISHHRWPSRKLPISKRLFRPRIIALTVRISCKETHIKLCNGCKYVSSAVIYVNLSLTVFFWSMTKAFSDFRQSQTKVRPSKSVRQTQTLDALLMKRRRCVGHWASRIGLG